MKKVLLTLLFLSSCGSQSQVIRVGVNPEYPPYEYLEGDEIVGFNVDVTKSALKNAGIEFELVPMAFDGLLVALQSKRIDLVIGVSPTEERRKSVDYTISYTEANPVALVTHKDNKFSEQELVGKKIGVLLGSVQESILELIDGVEIITYNNYTGSLLDLNNLKIDGILVSIEPAKEYLSENPNLVFSGLVKNNLYDGYALALNKGEDELASKLNKSLQELVDNGFITEIQNKYKINQASFE